MGIPLNIDWQQIILHMFNFSILAGGLYFLLFKPIKDFMDKRMDYYKDLDDRAKAKLTEAEDVKALYDSKLADADEEISRLNKEKMAKTQTDIDAQLADAKEQAEKMINSAKAEIEIEHQKMLEKTKKEVTDLAIEATRKLLEQSTKDPYGSFLQNVEGGASDDRA